MHTLLLSVCSCTPAPAIVHSSVTAHYCNVCRIISKFCCLATTVCCTQTAPSLSPPHCRTVRCSAIAYRPTLLQAALSTLSTNPFSGTSIDGQTDKHMADLITALPQVCRAKSADSKPLAAAAADSRTASSGLQYLLSTSLTAFLPLLQGPRDHYVGDVATTRKRRL